VIEPQQQARPRGAAPAAPVWLYYGAVSLGVAMGALMMVNGMMRAGILIVAHSLALGVLVGFSVPSRPRAPAEIGAADGPLPEADEG
jgi:hypothetical protein